MNRAVILAVLIPMMILIILVGPVPNMSVQTLPDSDRAAPT